MQTSRVTRGERRERFTWFRSRQEEWLETFGFLLIPVYLMGRLLVSAGYPGRT